MLDRSIQLASRQASLQGFLKSSPLVHESPGPLCWLTRALTRAGILRSSKWARVSRARCPLGVFGHDCRPSGLGGGRPPFFARSSQAVCDRDGALS